MTAEVLSDGPVVENATNTALDKLKLARQVGVPLAALETADPAAFLAALAELCNGSTPLVRWDCVRGFAGVNEPGRAAVVAAMEGLDPTRQTVAPDALKLAARFAERSILYFTGLDRLISGNNPTLAILVIQAIANLRDPFKTSARTLIIAGPAWKSPPELGGNVYVIRDPLPTRDELAGVVEMIAGSASIELDAAEKKSAVDALAGIPRFDAEQAAALSVRPKEPGSGVLVLDQKTLWERKEDAIDSCDGLLTYKGTETFADIAGVENAKRFFRTVIDADVYNCFVFIDEIDKAMAPSGAGDTSGTSQEILRGFLVEMQDQPNYSGSIFLGSPGACKSAFAKALAAESGKPLIQLDPNGLKDSLVGATGRNLRRAFQTIASISGGSACFIATCNDYDGLAELSGGALLRRFSLPHFFFPLPTLPEQEAIRDLYAGKWDLDLSSLPLGKLTGAEIRSAADLVRKFKFSPAAAAAYKVPLAVSDREGIERLETRADGRFTCASYEGAFLKQREEVLAAAGGARKFSL